MYMINGLLSSVICIFFTALCCWVWGESLLCWEPGCKSSQTVSSAYNSLFLLSIRVKIQWIRLYPGLSWSTFTTLIILICLCILPQVKCQKTEQVKQCRPLFGIDLNNNMCLVPLTHHQELSTFDDSQGPVCSREARTSSLCGDHPWLSHVW